MKQAGDGEVTPGVAHGDGFGNFGAGDKHRAIVISDDCSRRLKHTVSTGEFKTGNWLDESADDTPTVRGLEANTKTGALALDSFHFRAGIADFLTVGTGESYARETVTNLLFALRVYVG